MLVNGRGKTRFHCFHTFIADQLPQIRVAATAFSVRRSGSMHKRVRPSAVHKRIKADLLIVDGFGMVGTQNYFSTYMDKAPSNRATAAAPKLDVAHVSPYLLPHPSPLFSLATTAVSHGSMVIFGQNARHHISSG